MPVEGSTAVQPTAISGIIERVATLAHGANARRDAVGASGVADRPAPPARDQPVPAYAAEAVGAGTERAIADAAVGRHAGLPRGTHREARLAEVASSGSGALNAVGDFAASGHAELTVGGELVAGDAPRARSGGAGEAGEPVGIGTVLADVSERIIGAIGPIHAIGQIGHIAVVAVAGGRVVVVWTEQAAGGGAEVAAAETHRAVVVVVASAAADGSALPVDHDVTLALAHPAERAVGRRTPGSGERGQAQNDRQGRQDRPRC